MGILGVMIGALCGQGTVAVFAGIGTAYRGRSGIGRWSLVRGALSYSLPLVPSAVLFGLPRVLDRFFLERFAPLASLGFYSLGNSIGNVTSHAQQALKNAWIPMAMRMGIERPDGLAIIGRFGRYYATVLAGVALAVAMLSREAILLVSPDRYGAVAAYVPAFSAVASLGVLEVLASVGFSLKNRTARLLGIATLQAAMGAVTIGVGAWRWGPVGALAGVLAARIVGVGVSFAVSQGVCPIPYGLRRLGLITALAGAAYAAGTVVHPLPLVACAAVKLGILVVWAAAAAGIVLEGGMTAVRREIALLRGR
jgi:O-antigen/teichoic acid export membrane protein